MTEPARVGNVLPGVLAEVVDRAGHGYDRWMELVAQAGYCHHPIRLAGRVEHADRQTGEVRPVYDSEREPDGVLLKACGTRRESRCPSCAATYRADAYQLLSAGLKGGKGIPETVNGHPRLFVTFTAPSFGKVHRRKAQGRLVLPCHPYRQGARCSHGLRDGCWHRHDEDDSRLGEPLCPPCYDAGAQVLWNALAPELWRRTTIALHRVLARLVGLQEGELRRLVRISYAKVAEFQRRGAIHFHAVIRLDADTDCRCPGCLAPPLEPFTAALLEDALRQAVPLVRVPCPPLPNGGPERYARWGEQLDVHNITEADGEAGDLSAEQVAGYIAKYATKATESFGSGLDRRLDADDLAQLDQLPAHVAELVRAAWELGGQPELERLRLRAWAHMLGFGGHWSTKSRRYSTTFTVLRRARVAFAKQRRARDGVPLDAWGGPRTTRPWSWSPLGCTSAWAMRPRGNAGWPCRLRLGLANSERWPARNFAPCPPPSRGRIARMDKLMTFEEAAERLGTTPRHMRRLVVERRIAYRKLGRYVRFHPDDLAEYVAAHRVRADQYPEVG